jgi:hypothetical protein
MVCVGFAAANPALGCSVVRPVDYAGSVQERRDVRNSINRATLIVDGEVIRPWSEGVPAIVRVAHILKGSAPERIEVGSPEAGLDCTIALTRTGERSRMILVGGPHVFSLLRENNPRLEDHYLRSDRRKVWPYFRGTP